jgi:hypothetical protein
MESFFVIPFHIDNQELTIQSLLLINPLVEALGNMKPRYGGFTDIQSARKRPNKLAMIKVGIHTFPQQPPEKPIQSVSGGVANK